jgi:hypothetical protein
MQDLLMNFFDCKLRVYGNLPACGVFFIAVLEKV